MRTFSMLSRSVAALMALSGLGAMPGFAQTFAASTGTDVPVINISARDTQSPSAHHNKKTDDPLLYGRVRDGVYTVDGMVAKVQLNYNVEGANYLYLFVPGVGTAVVSAVPERDSVAVPVTLRGDELSFTVGEHHFKLTGVDLSNSKGAVPSHLYARLDREAWRLNRQPMIGFGHLAELPYEWPGALPPANGKVEESRVAPPVPAVLLPSKVALTPAVSGPVAVNPGALQPVAMRR